MKFLNDSHGSSVEHNADARTEGLKAKTTLNYKFNQELYDDWAYIREVFVEEAIKAGGFFDEKEEGLPQGGESEGDERGSGVLSNNDYPRNTYPESRGKWCA